MGQAPATGKISLRTVPRNFPGRSGVKEDKVCLVSPETAASSALTGVITDPRTLEFPYPKISDPADPIIHRDLLTPPPPDCGVEPLRKGPNITSIPEFDPLPDDLDLPVLLKVGDNISTDEIMPAGARVLPFRSNIPRISEFVYEAVDDTYPARARKQTNGHCIIGGSNYGQGSSREHAALAPRYLGLRAVLAKGFARIHRQNLVNFGVVPLELTETPHYEEIETGDRIGIRDIRNQLANGNEVSLEIGPDGRKIRARHGLSNRQVEMVLAGGLINWLKQRLSEKDRRRSVSAS
jgi:aconitate hydratase